MSRFINADDLSMIQIQMMIVIMILIMILINKKPFIVARMIFFIVAGKIKKYKCPGLLHTNKIFL